MEARQEIAKRPRPTGTSDADDTGSQGSAGAAACSGVAAEMDGQEVAVVAAAEAEVVGSAETEEHVQRILLAIVNFTRKLSEMLDSGRVMFKDLAADFEDRLCTIHKERVEKWEEEIPDPRRPPQRPAPALPHPPVVSQQSSTSRALIPSASIS